MYPVPAVVILMLVIAPLESTPSTTACAEVPPDDGKFTGVPIAYPAPPPIISYPVIAPVLLLDQVTRAPPITTFGQLVEPKANVPLLYPEPGNETATDCTTPVEEITAVPVAFIPPGWVGALNLTGTVLVAPVLNPEAIVVLLVTLAIPPALEGFKFKLPVPLNELKLLTKLTSYVTPL